VQAATPTLTFDAGADAALSEGQTFSRSINFSDGQDNGAAGWNYSINYGDGSAVQTGTTLTQSLNLSHVYADGASSANVSVTITDEPGESVTDGFVVTVNNVVPTATVGGADTVNEGTAYVLNVGAITDPGQDTRTGYTINWGDGSTDSFTPAQWLAAAGAFSHTFADGGNGGTARSITVSTTDEDGTFTLGSKSITVANVSPVVTLGGNATTNEGASYTLNISANDAAGAADPLSYSIDWGDGTAVQNLTAAQLLALGGNVAHVFADDQDGPINATARTVTVTANDGDGGIGTLSKVVTVNNVAPTIAITGAATAQVNQTYTLNLGAVTDPGQDTVTSYVIDWGDGTLQTVGAGGNVTHTYTSAGARTVLLDLVDEDGTYLDVASLAVNVQSQALNTVRIGDAPDRQTGSGGQWQAAWTSPLIDTVHKAVATNAAEAWTSVKFSGAQGNLLIGNDIFSGDLGVSGQTMATSSVRQELDGTEALRFNLTQSATSVTMNLSRFFINDDGGVMAEAGLVRLLDAQGNVVGQQAFTANGSTGAQQVTASAAAGFVAAEVWAGAYNGNDFVFGAYASASNTAVPPSATHGSEFLLDWIEFSFPVPSAPVIGIDQVPHDTLFP
jgi:large repetitive protein